MSPLRKIRIDFELWWSEWKRLHWKHKGPYSIEELEKIRQFHHYLSYTWLMNILILLCMIMDMYLSGKGDVVINTTLVVCMIALYDTKMEIAHLNQIIYLKRRWEDVDYGK